MHDALGIRRLDFLDHDIAVLAVAAVGGECDPLAIARPAGFDVTGLTVGQAHRRGFRVGGVLEEELEILVTADVGGVEQSPAARLHLPALHRLDAARQGEALRQRRGHRMEVRRVAEARRHDRLAARGVPAAEARAAQIEVGRELGGQCGGDGRDAFGDDVGRHGGQADGGEQAEADGEQGGAAHVLSLL